MSGTRIEWGVHREGDLEAQRALTEALARSWANFANTHGVPCQLLTRTITTGDWELATDE